MVCVGPNLKKAAWLAVEIEALAAQYWRALQVGVPYVLSDEEIAKVIEKFKSYGQPASKANASCC